MLWLALHFHSLSLEVFSRGAAVPEPLAVVEKQGSRTWVIACNDTAESCGVRVGMAAPAAQALADGLIVRRRDLSAERESLAGLAVWAGRFTPSVSIEPPDGLMLEISTCLRLHRGLGNLLKQARSGVGEMGYAAMMACGPSSHGAWLLAKAGIEKAVRDTLRLETILATLPVALLDQTPAVLEGLERVGAQTLNRPIILTFDDGSETVFTTAMPIMQKYGFTGTAFIVYNYIGAGLYMSGDQIKSLHDSGWEIGSHSLSHVNLRQRPGKQEDEISSSKRRLEERLGFPIPVFAYPFGANDASSLKLVRESGYIAAVVLGEGVRQSAENIYYLYRRDVTSAYDLRTFAGFLPCRRT